MAFGILALVASAACIAGTALAWSGRWRRWPLQVFGPFPLTILPAIAAFLLAAGLDGTGVISAASPVGGACFVAALICFFAFTFTPRWWGPRWYRERDRTASPDLGDPLSAGLMAAVVASGPADEVPPRSAVAAEAGPAEQAWKGSWMAGDESQAKAHGLTHAGAIEGHLQLHPAAVSFVASRIEDLLRGEPTVLTIAGDELRAVRVVPRGAGADGQPTEGHGPRSLFPRLVLETDRDTFLFEVQSAKRTARRIGEQLGVAAIA